MRPYQYFISYDYKPNRNGEYCYHQNTSTDWFVVFVFKFLWLRRKYKTMDVEFRDKHF